AITCGDQSHAPSGFPLSSDPRDPAAPFTALIFGLRRWRAGRGRPARAHDHPFPQLTRKPAMPRVETLESAPRRSLIIGAGLLAGGRAVSAGAGARAATPSGDV